MYIGARRIAVFAVVIGALVATAAGAWAITVTTPTQNPFTVSGDASGNPLPFDISVSGLNQFQPAFAVECDGVDPNSQGYTVSEHCDNGSSGSSVNGDASGNATFAASNSNTHLRVFKGESPQSFFNCLSPNDPDPNDGLPSFRNCQVRVSAGTPADTSNQQFFSIVLPDTPAPTTTTTTTSTTSTSTSTTSTSTTSTSTSTTSTSTSTTTTTIPTNTNPQCTMGAGLVQPPPKPPKNAGLIKISKGLMDTPAAKPTKFTISGTLENCQDFPTVPKQAGPIMNGAFKLSLQIQPGSTCAGISAGAILKSSLSISWSTPDPLKPGKFKKVSSEKTTALSYRQSSTDPFTLNVTSADFGIKSKTPGFSTQHAVISIVTDQTASQIATGCADPKKGLAVLNFTGARGVSTLEVH